MSEASYIIISPVRNEAKYLPLTIDSLKKQTVRPKRWLIVDDGSTDGTGEVIETAASQHNWLKAIRRTDRGFRQAGEGVMDAFYDGYRLIANEWWDYLVKLDGDLSFADDYFEQCFRHFATNSKLGIAGGTICNLVSGTLEVESKIDPVFHVRGATKIYRRECWQHIGGLIRAPGWDTVDEVKANMMGWTTCTFPDLKVVHHRLAGSAYGQWSNLIKNGRANYVVGYHPVFMLVKCMRRLFEKPYGIVASGLLLGFLGGYLKRIPQVDDKDLIKYFRQQQFNRLFGRKSLWG